MALSKERTWCRLLLSFLLFLFMRLFPPAEAANVYWINPAGGSWSATTNWSTGTIPGSNDNVFIISNGNYAVTLDVNATVAAFNFGGAMGTQNLSITVNALFTLTGTGTVNDRGLLSLDGGTILGGTINLGASPFLCTAHGGTLDGVTVNGDMDLTRVNGANATIVNGLVLNGTAYLGNPTNDSTYGLLNFSGSQTLGGNGTVIFGGASCNSMRLINSGTTLTLGPGIIVRGHSGQIGYDICQGGASSVEVLNQGAISADVSGGTIVIRAQPFTNNGLLQSPAGTINLAGTVVTPGLGTVQSAGGVVLVTGVLDNTNHNLLLNGPGYTLTLQGAIIHGGAVTGTNGGQLIFSSSTLDGVTVNGDMDLTRVNGANATIVNGLVLNGTAYLGNPTNDSTYGLLNFSGSQTLGGNGTVIFGGASCNSMRLINSGTTLTLGPGIIVRGHSGQIGYDICQGGASSVEVLNQGAISADVSGGTIVIRAQPFTNNGLLQSPVGTINLAGTVVNAGQFSLGRAPGIVNITGEYVQSTSGTLSIEIGGLTPGNGYSQLRVSGMAMLAGTLQATLTNGFLPQVADQFVVMTFGSRSGAFANITGDASYFIAQHNPNDVQLVARNPVPPEILVRVNGSVAVASTVVVTNRAAIELLTSLAGGSVRYTLNGGPPSSGVLYTVPLMVTQTVVVRALAFNVAGMASPEMNPIQVVVVAPPAILLQPQDQLVGAGEDVVFAALVAGTPLPHLQWLRNGLVLAGATNSLLLLTNVLPGPPADFALVASNILGVVTSVVARLDVLGPPTIITQPASVTVAVGGSATFLVSAFGPPPLQFLSSTLGS